jgi:hypothetical protein
VVHELNERDRDAVLLRFFEGRPFSEIGNTLNVSEDGARMRVERALEKLRVVLGRRGVHSTSAALAATFANQVGASAPTGMTSVITSAALTAAGTGVKGAGTWLAFLTMTKIEIGIGGLLLAIIIGLGANQVRANRSLRAEIATLESGTRNLDRLRAENLQLTSAVDRIAATSPDAAELAQLRTRVAQVQARPPWVAESRRKAVAAATNAGWSTADAALETYIWASSHGDRDTLAKNFTWVGDAKEQADAAFARLSDAVRARYGSADRVAGAVCFGRGDLAVTDHKWASRGSVPDWSATVNATNTADDPVVAYWADIDPEARLARPGIILRVWSWAQLASGQERQLIIDLCYAGGSWTVGTSRFSPEGWNKIIAQIDPTTGELLPPKK